MDDQSIETCARLLLELRREMRTVAALPADSRPNTEADAYAVQDRLHELSGDEIGALKVGCTGLAAQQALGFDSPFGARIARSAVFDGGATLPVERFHHVPYVEGEIAMRLGADVGPADPLDEAGVRELVVAVAPAIELVDSRFDEMLGVDGMSMLADNGVAAALVLGNPVEPARDLAAVEVTIDAGGTTIASGSGEQVLGDPYLSLLWVLQHEQARGRTVGAGTWVTTGTCTGLVPAPTNEVVRAVFGGLGEVSVTIAS